MHTQFTYIYTYNMHKTFTYVYTLYVYHIYKGSLLTSASQLAAGYDIWVMRPRPEISRVTFDLGSMAVG